MAKKFKPGQAVWYFDYLGANASKGPDQREFRKYRYQGSMGLVSSPYGHDVALNIHNLYVSAEAAVAGEEAKHRADMTIEKLAAEDAILEAIINEAVAQG